MNASSLLWLFVLLTFLQPVIQKRLLDASRRRLIARIEKRRGSRVIVLAHRQETMRFLGFPLMRYIDIEDSEDVLRAIHMTDPDIPVDLVLHTPGGLVLASMQIARAIHHRPGTVTVFVPHYAMSGGTLIALAADEIVMSPHAVLGPVDPQVGEYPAAAILGVLHQKTVDRVDDHTLILADQATKAVRQLQRGVRELLADKVDANTADQLAKILCEGRWTHDHAITFEDAQGLGLTVRTAMPEEFLRLMTLFPQPVRRNPAVEYLHVPRRAGSPGEHMRSR